MKVTVIGAGSWGTALALKSLQAANVTGLYCRRQEQVAAIRALGENKEYLPGVIVPPELTLSHSLEDLVPQADMVLLVTPSIYVRETCQRLKEHLHEGQILILCAKGLDKETGHRLSTIMKEIVGFLDVDIALLSGPNHAEEVGRNLPAMAVVASDKLTVAERVQKALSTPTFRLYVNKDMVGVELAGTTKNIIALAAGASDGLGLGDNAKAALLTRGLHEMAKFGMALGANRETYAGLAGMGDLIDTCMSQHSRNRRAGIALAAGQTMDYIREHTHMVVEGFFAVESVYKVAKKLGLDLPITNALYEVLYQKKSVKDALQVLMDRSLKDEMYI